MEANMKKVTWAALALTLTILLVLGLGCSTNKDGTGSSDGSTGANSVQIVMPSDTLRFVPGDSAVAQGFVVVKDGAQNALPGVRVRVELTQPFGVIEFINTDTTDAQGRVHFWFRTYRDETGNNVIHAYVGSKESFWPITVLPSVEVLGRITLTLSRDNLTVAPPLEDSVTVKVTLVDSGRVGISNVTVHLSAQDGRMAPLPPTDAAGQATTVWYTANCNAGIYRLTARVGNLSDSTFITVHNLDAVQGILTLRSNRNLLHADGCITFASLTATLKDQSGVAVVGDTIRFATPRLGAANAVAVTDTVGEAHSTFCPGSIPCADPTDSAYVIARYARWGLADTFAIWIDAASTVNRVVLIPSATVGRSVLDTARLDVQAIYDDGSLVSGRLVQFHSDCRVFNPLTDVETLGSDGRASYQWPFCPNITELGEFAHVWATVEGVSSDTVSMTVNPGPATTVTIPPFQNVTQIGHPVELQALVQDSLGHHVRAGQGVQWTTTLGTIPPSSTTDNSGVATAQFSPGTTAGSAIIKAFITGDTATVLVVVTPGVGANIQLDVSNPSIQVAGTGGQEYTQLLATVRDANGNPAIDGLPVTFTITTQPGGAGSACNINNHGNSDMAQTSGGLAIATLNAGTIPGPVSVSASTPLTDTTVTYATYSGISVVSGPPNSIEIQPNSVGTDAGASWDVPVQALVNDAYNNPVRNGVSVFFSVVPDTASILSDTVTTGNGPGLPGVAVTTLRYISAATNQLVEITARAVRDSSGNEVSASVIYQLPIQQPTIQLQLEPQSWHFGIPTQGDPCRIRCTALVLDGHTIPINGTNVIYATTRGRLFPVNNNNGQDQYHMLSGPVDSQYGPGHAVLWLVEWEQYIFPDPLSPEITGDVTVVIDGTPAASDTKTINFRR
jgi:hypothetical protein